MQKGHPLYHSGGQCVSVVFTVDRHWIFLREKYKDRLRNSKSQMISNLIFSFHPLHDVVHLVDVLTTNHHNIAWQRVFKCCESSLKKINCICQNNSLFYLKRLYVPEECYILCCQVHSKLRVIFVTIEISIFAQEEKEWWWLFISCQLKNLDKIESKLENRTMKYWI